MAWQGFEIRPQPGPIGAMLGGFNTGLEQGTEATQRQQQLDLYQQQQADTQKIRRAQINADHIRALPAVAEMDPDQAKAVLKMMKEDRDALGLSTSPLVDYLASLKPEDTARLRRWGSPTASLLLGSDPTQVMEGTTWRDVLGLGQDITAARGAESSASAGPSAETASIAGGAVGPALLENQPQPLSSLSAPSSLDPFAGVKQHISTLQRSYDVLTNRIDNIVQRKQGLAGEVVYTRQGRDYRDALEKQLEAERLTLEGWRKTVEGELLASRRPVLVGAAQQLWTPESGYLPRPRPAAAGPQEVLDAEGVPLGVNVVDDRTGVSVFHPYSREEREKRGLLRANKMSATPENLEWARQQFQDTPQTRLARERFDFFMRQATGIMNELRSSGLEDREIKQYVQPAATIPLALGNLARIQTAVNNVRAKGLLPPEGATKVSMEVKRWQREWAAPSDPDVLLLKTRLIPTAIGYDRNVLGDKGVRAIQAFGPTIEVLGDRIPSAGALTRLITDMRDGAFDEWESHHRLFEVARKARTFQPGTLAQMQELNAMVTGAMENVETLIGTRPKELEGAFR